MWEIVAEEGMPFTIRALELESGQRQALLAVVRSAKSSVRDVRRARIVLCRADGLSQAQTAAQVGVNRPVVSTWEGRFRREGIAGLRDKKGRGRKASLPAHKKAVALAEATRPPKGRTRWSVRSMARHAGLSPTTVHGLWQANDLKPHLTRTFKLSRDPQFEPKFWDVIGLYLHPPHKALVLCCDEKSQCQALERTQPGLPLGIGHIRTRTHDYTRHGTVTLFAALGYLDGKIFAQTAPRHTHREWLAFLQSIERQTPRELDLHLIVDNYATHKHPAVRAWLARHPRMHLHFTPTSSSWLNLVERFFRDLSEDVIREGSFASVRELVAAIEHYLAERNLHPKPYRWKASGQAILEKIHRARSAQAASDSHV